MLSPREQPSWWSRIKAPAAVSLACLAATLLIAAQGFRGHPTTKHSELPAQHSGETLRHEESIGQSLDKTSVVAQQRFKQAQEDEREARVKNADPHLSLSTSAAASASSLHKQKSFEYVEINTAGEHRNSALNMTMPTHLGNITAYLEELQGLPEEVNVTKAAVNRDFAVVAFSSLDRDTHRCWDVSYGTDLSTSKDVALVLSVWQEIMEREGWAKIPRYALGGSSGGSFALHLAQRLPLDGVIPIISSVPSTLLEAKPRAADQSKSWPFPPTFFIHMSRDDVTAQSVASNIAALRKQGTLVNQIAVGPRSINSSFFSDRIETIDPAVSGEMHQALLNEGCLNITGFLIDNPRGSSMLRKWQKALRENVASCKTMSFKMDESPVFEELNVAWAAHELVSDYTDLCLDWFSSLDGPKLMTAVNPRLE